MGEREDTWVLNAEASVISLIVDIAHQQSEDEIWEDSESAHYC